MSGTVVLVLDGPIGPADAPCLCARLGERLDAGGHGTALPVVVCDVSALSRPDAVTVDALARLQLTARRRGARVVLRHPRESLRALLALAGLSEVVPVSGVEGRGQAEEGEQLGVEEVRDADDPAL